MKRPNCAASGEEYTRILKLMDAIEEVIRQQTNNGNEAGQALFLLSASLMRANSVSRESFQHLAGCAWDDMKLFCEGEAPT